ncbi:PILR alpha-associated neural protein isoform X3 [Channa argus]|uniref:PILR alpha-associated neural protein isoform X3 n=1 Tax=Channa argus TaxID=215402 RepID=UPI003520F5DE
MERCSISPVARLTGLISLLLVVLVTHPSTCNRHDSEGEEQVDTLSVHLSVTAEVTPTPLWAVVWGPTQQLEDETYHFLSSQETDPLRQHGKQQEASTITSEDWPHPEAGMNPIEKTRLEGVEDGETEAEETEPEEVTTAAVPSTLPRFPVAWLPPSPSHFLVPSLQRTAGRRCTAPPPPSPTERGSQL